MIETTNNSAAVAAWLEENKDAGLHVKAPPTGEQLKELEEVWESYGGDVLRQMMRRLLTRNGQKSRTLTTFLKTGVLDLMFGEVRPRNSKSATAETDEACRSCGSTAWSSKSHGGCNLCRDKWGKPVQPAAPASKPLPRAEASA